MMKWRREDIEITFPYQGICFFQLIDPKFQFRFMKRQHLIDVTEVFRTLSAEKKYRVAKLAFYLFLFIIVIIRFSLLFGYRILAAGSLSLYQSEEELDIRSSFLEF
ncbi:hypothetical protein CK203_012290 [Vitis vinifera]|uniref:Uncharacterized protein n=1 Tax=Vitis vinifera TaxID=29760 RepID=A0A438JL82_VITVI|nr:hypothetical protein CK203_074462 [Vitis vinifera]RVX09704.1 hypothetical protein CK203_012290 [Vitis vinifera]